MKEIKSVACLGAGIIGYSWALNFAMKNLNVYLYDISEDALNLAKERITESLKPLIENKVIKDTDTTTILGHIKFTTDLKEAVCNADFIEEAVPENYEIKQNLVAEVEKYANEDAIFASSTSGLLITKICEHAKYQERFIGTHPYNPPHLIPLVEITKGEKTSEEVIDTAKKFFQSIDKEPVVLQKEALGFICNRLQMALYREVCYLVMNGVCSVEDADKAVTFGPGLRWGIMGPSLVFELGGGQNGISGLMKHLNSSIELWLNDMADFKKFPEEWADIVQEGVNEEIKNRPDSIGNDLNSLAKYRDDMLIELLKLHNKL